MLNFYVEPQNNHKLMTLMSVTGTVAQLVERPLCDQEVASLIPDQVISKTLKLILAALSLGAQH